MSAANGSHCTQYVECTSIIASLVEQIEKMTVVHLDCDVPSCAVKSDVVREHVEDGDNRVCFHAVRSLLQLLIDIDRERRETNQLWLHSMKGHGPVGG